MNRYDYVCQKCSHELRDVLQSIKDPPKKKCPECGKRGLKRVLYGGLLVSVKQDPTTIGQLADKNASKMGSYQKSEIEEKKKKSEPATDKDAPATRVDINKMSEKQKHRYIMEGKK